MEHTLTLLYIRSCGMEAHPPELRSCVLCAVLDQGATKEDGALSRVPPKQLCSGCRCKQPGCVVDEFLEAILPQGDQREAQGLIARAGGRGDGGDYGAPVVRSARRGVCHHVTVVILVQPIFVLFILSPNIPPPPPSPPVNPPIAKLNLFFVAMGTNIRRMNMLLLLLSLLLFGSEYVNALWCHQPTAKQRTKSDSNLSGCGVSDLPTWQVLSVSAVGG